MKNWKFWLLIALIAMLSACAEKADEAPKIDPLAVPTSTDKDAWRKFMNAVMKETKFTEGAKGIYPYYVGEGDDTRKREVIQESIRNGIQPGYAYVITGADSTKVADFIVSAFAEAKPDTLLQTKLLFIGKQADDARVRGAVEPSGMAVVFHGTD